MTAVRGVKISLLSRVAHAVGLHILIYAVIAFALKTQVRPRHVARHNPAPVHRTKRRTSQLMLRAACPSRTRHLVQTASALTFCSTFYPSGNGNTFRRRRSL